MFFFSAPVCLVMQFIYATQLIIIVSERFKYRVVPAVYALFKTWHIFAKVITTNLLFGNKDQIPEEFSALA